MFYFWLTNSQAVYPYRGHQFTPLYHHFLSGYYSLHLPWDSCTSTSQAWCRILVSIKLKEIHSTLPDLLGVFLDFLFDFWYNSNLTYGRLWEAVGFGLDITFFSYPLTSNVRRELGYNVSAIANFMEAHFLSPIYQWFCLFYVTYVADSY